MQESTARPTAHQILPRRAARQYLHKYLEAMEVQARLHQLVEGTVSLLV